jgi:hypothetical protein
VNPLKFQAEFFFATTSLGNALAHLHKTYLYRRYTYSMAFLTAKSKLRKITLQLVIITLGFLE